MGPADEVLVQDHPEGYWRYWRPSHLGRQFGADDGPVGDAVLGEAHGVLGDVVLYVVWRYLVAWPCGEAELGDLSVYEGYGCGALDRVGVCVWVLGRLPPGVGWADECVQASSDSVPGLGEVLDGVGAVGCFAALVGPEPRAVGARLGCGGGHGGAFLTALGECLVEEGGKVAVPYCYGVYDVLGQGRFERCGL